MILNPRKLRVVVNQHHALDHQGRPSGAVRLDPAESAGMRLYIGARLGSVEILVERDRVEQSAGLAPTVQVNRWVFDERPQEIDDTATHRAWLRQGCLFPADEATHRTVFGRDPRRPFVLPALAIAEARAKAIVAWQAEHDGEEPAFVAEEATTTTASAPPAPATIEER